MERAIPEDSVLIASTIYAPAPRPAGRREGEVLSPEGGCGGERRLLQRSLFVVVTRGHGDDDVLAIFVVQVFHPQDHLVLLHAELRLLTDRQQRRVLFVPRTDAVDHLVG